MATLQKSDSLSLMGTLAASCLLLIALSVPGGEAAPIGSLCKLDKAEFTEYITNYTYLLFKEAASEDKNTDVRLIWDIKLFRHVIKTERCYLMKQVLNFTLEELLMPFSQESSRFLPYMPEVVSFLKRLSNKLNQCHIESKNPHIQKNVQELKDTVKKLGESAKTKVTGEVNLLFEMLRKSCADQKEAGN
ncbi:PREDICTED: interleukin-22 [Condylura cristata]|uniref:interleukin-22 n=1 Tax=Condylura cristata TaxID=143302 RepID=UPI0003345F84|nr:PREDICTED: interleukin-22 [Condylura cristata]